MSVQRLYFAADGRQLTEAEATECGMVRDGVRVQARVQFLDGVPQLHSAGDAERIYADSVKGKRSIALARRDHDLGERHKLQPQSFTDTHAAGVVRAELGITDTLEQLQRARDAAMQAKKDALSFGVRA